MIREYTVNPHLSAQEREGWTDRKETPLWTRGCTIVNRFLYKRWTDMRFLAEVNRICTHERNAAVNKRWIVLGSVCKVRTQDPENFDEEVKSLVTAWHKDSQKLFSSYQIHKENPLETRQIMSLTNYLWSCVVSRSFTGLYLTLSWRKDSLGYVWIFLHFLDL